MIQWYYIPISILLVHLLEALALYCLWPTEKSIQPLIAEDCEETP